ncbi:response regulator [Brevundimonas sp.]|uniref:response regulator n=1 Tax=Brevundimonas sp. TaxID=1871086 RepID=UPI001224BEAF|nr:response regulator [Brevundimonas sp.]TAJ65238.1 MAG: response regulator [Brevundimonas sp.]
MRAPGDIARGGETGLAARTLPRVIVVEDEGDIREPLARYLTRNHFQVTAVGSAEAARHALATGACDLLLVDIMLPGEDGLSLTREILATTDIPVMLVTARTEMADRLVGLDLGADDYICKPFDARELVARLRTVLRRVRRTSPAADAPAWRRFVFGDWTLEAGTRSLRRGDGTPRPLTSGEYRLLHALVSAPGRVLSREQLLDLTPGRDAEPFDRSIDNQISRLRRRLEDDPRNPRWIRTVWGAGYMLDVKVVRT